MESEFVSIKTSDVISGVWCGSSDFCFSNLNAVFENFNKF